MRPAEKIEKFIKNVPLETKVERDREVLGDALRALKESKERDKRQPNIWKAIMKSRMTKLTAAAVIIITVLFTVNSFDDTSAWAQIARALDEVENVRVTATMRTANGELAEAQWLFKKPCFLREEFTETTVIDNGKDRLVLNREAKTAQYMESLAPWKPISEHEVFHTLGLFGGKDSHGYELTHLTGESSDSTLVYSIKYKEIFEGKAWVEADTMRPLRIAAVTIGEPESGGVREGQFDFNYKEIPTEAFSMTIPAGFKELPRKQRGIIAGKVVDERGNGVAGALVYVADRAGQFAENVLADEQGSFLFKLPPEGSGARVLLPVFVRAFEKGKGGRVAWTIIEDPKQKKDRGVEIPGQTGLIEVGNGVMLQSVNGIVLKMESAGTISGHVTDMHGDPISGAEVLVEGHPSVRKPGIPIYPEFGFIGDPMGGDGPRGELATRTNEQGRYEIANVPKFSTRARYKISASADGFATNGHDMDMIWKSSFKQVNLKLYRAGITVSGTLVDNYGQALEMRRIFGRVDDRDFCQTKTDKEGRFVLEECPVSPKLKIKAELSHNSWPPHERERYKSYRYHPDVVVPVDYEEGKTEYEVKLVAQRPEAVVEVELKNTQGEVLPFFPVEIRGAPGSISSQWEADKKFKQRTDEKGYCCFTEVPNVEDLRLVLWGGNSVWKDLLSREEARKVKKKYEKYKWTEVPIKLIPEQKEYKIEVALLTREEFEAKQ